MWLIQIPMTILLHASRSNGTFNAEASADGPEAERLHTVAFRMFWGTMMVGTGPLLGRLRLHSVMTAFKPLHRDQGARDLGTCMGDLSCASVLIPCGKLEHRCTGTLGPPVSGNVPVHLSTPSRPKHPRPSPKASARLVMGTSGHDR